MFVDDNNTVFTEQFRLFMYDDANGIRHVFKVPICYFEDLADFGVAFIGQCDYEIEDLMLGRTSRMTASSIQHIVNTGKHI
jgi:hypothetical protein